jgi:carboxymethylenebutenolidase
MEAALQTYTLSFPGENRTLNAFFARPEGDGPFPGVLVIHEAYGLNENIREIARRFAGEGYAALAVDLFTGRNMVVCMFRLFSGMRRNSLDHEGVRDLKAALTALAAQPGVDGARLGAVGFCLGGGLAIGLACTDQRVKAIAPFYGANPNPLEAVKRACPVVGSYPEKDFTAGQGRALEAALERAGVPHDIKIYPGARHSFFNDTGRSYNAEAAGDSWERIRAFFNQYVRAAQAAQGAEGRIKA